MTDDVQPKPKAKKPMTKKERHQRFLGIKRYYRERMAQRFAINSPEYRLARQYMLIIDRIGADDLESFLSFLGVKLPKSTIQMWTDVQKVDNLLNNLTKYRDKIDKKQT